MGQHRHVPALFRNRRTEYDNGTVIDMSLFLDGTEAQKKEMNT